MSGRSEKTLEMAANLSVIIVAFLGCILLTKSLLYGGRSPMPVAPKASDATPEIGFRIALPDVDWTAHKRTMVLVLSTRCRFCSESAPFFRRLAQEVKGSGDTAMIAIFPQDVKEGAAYLRNLDVPVDTVLQAPISSVGAKGTPTLILADNEGLVEKAWVGRVPPDREPELIGWLKQTAHGGR
jgi:hypothetical protein